MKIVAGEKFLITTSQWFYAPDGRTYRAVFGTVRAVLGDSEALGIRTNARSTNWYVEIGDMVIAGCQIHYAVKCQAPPPERVRDQHTSDGKAVDFVRDSHCWNADLSGAAA